MDAKAPKVTMLSLAVVWLLLVGVNGLVNRPFEFELSVDGGVGTNPSTLTFARLDLLT